MTNVSAHFFGGPRDGWARLLPVAETEIRVPIFSPPRWVSESPRLPQNYEEAVYELQWASRRTNRAVYEYQGDKPAIESAAWYVRPFEEGKRRLEGRYIVSRELLEDGMLCDRDLGRMIGEGLVAQMRRVLAEDDEDGPCPSCEDGCERCDSRYLRDADD